MLRNPAYAGRACFGKTMRAEQTAGLNRTARQAGRATPPQLTITDRPRQHWLEIPVPALVDQDTWGRGSSGGWRTTSASPRATRIPRCCMGSAPVPAAATPTTDLDAHLDQEDLLLRLSGLGRLPLRARPDLRTSSASITGWCDPGARQGTGGFTYLGGGPHARR